MIFDRWRRDRFLDDAPDEAAAPVPDLATADGSGLPGHHGRPDGDCGEAADRDPLASDAETMVPVSVEPAGLDELTTVTLDGPEVASLADALEACLDVDEIEAFLEGRLVEHRSSRGRSVPAWAVVNKLAHGDASELARLAGGIGVAEREPAWLGAQRGLAAELLAGRTPAQVACIQREVLVPLELWLVDRAESTTVTGRWAAELADALLTA
jgi:hypothetical protein